MSESKQVTHYRGVEVAAIIRQRDALLEAAKAAIDSLSQKATFPADIARALRWLRAAIDDAKGEGS